jgi:hypothetical protein
MGQPTVDIRVQADQSAAQQIASGIEVALDACRAAWHASMHADALGEGLPPGPEQVAAWCWDQEATHALIGTALASSGTAQPASILRLPQAHRR